MIRIFPVLMIIIFAQPAMAQYRKDTSIDGVKYRLAFNDNFSKRKLNKRRWNYRTDSKMWSTQLPANVTVGNGNLYLNVKKEKANGKDYTGGGIISKKAFGQGYYEARFKVPPGAGWHTSFWLMYHDSMGGTGPSKTTLEYDICENDSKNKNGYSMTIHKWKGQHKTYRSKFLNTPDLSAGFHTWGCEILPGKVHYYFDGTLGHTIAVDDTKLPSSAVFDYVRFYKRVD